MSITEIVLLFLIVLVSGTGGWWIGWEAACKLYKDYDDRVTAGAAVERQRKALAVTLSSYRAGVATIAGLAWHDRQDENKLRERIIALKSLPVIGEEKP